MVFGMKNDYLILAKMQKRLRALLELAVMTIGLACALFVIAQGLTFFSNVYSEYSELEIPGMIVLVLVAVARLGILPFVIILDFLSIAIQQKTGGHDKRYVIKYLLVMFSKTILELVICMHLGSDAMESPVWLAMVGYMSWDTFISFFYQTILIFVLVIGLELYSSKYEEKVNLSESRGKEYYINLIFLVLNLKKAEDIGQREMFDTEKPQMQKLSLREMFAPVGVAFGIFVIILVLPDVDLGDRLDDGGIREGIFSLYDTETDGVEANFEEENRNDMDFQSDYSDQADSVQEESGESYTITDVSSITGSYISTSGGSEKAIGLEISETGDGSVDLTFQSFTHNGTVSVNGVLTGKNTVEAEMEFGSETADFLLTWTEGGMVTVVRTGSTGYEDIDEYTANEIFINNAYYQVG